MANPRPNWNEPDDEDLFAELPPGDEEAWESVARLSRDLVASAALLTEAQARFLVDR